MNSPSTDCLLHTYPLTHDLCNVLLSHRDDSVGTPGSDEQQLVD